MPSVVLSQCFVDNQQFLYGNSPVANGKLYTYEAGTTTLVSSYKDSGGTILHANPIILDSNGRLQDPIWLIRGQAYKFVLTNSAGATWRTWDNLTVWDTVDGRSDAIYSLTKEELNAVATTENYIAPQNYRYPPGNVLRYGYNTVPGTTDMKDAVAACLKCNTACYFPPGTYFIGSTVEVGAGQVIYGDSRTTTTIISPGNTTTFNWRVPGGVDTDGPIIHDLRINSDVAIRINDLSTLVVDGAGDSPCSRAELYNLELSPITQNSGAGIIASKMFGSQIRDNLIVRYANGIIMQGCDLNKISLNRIMSFTTYGILDLSAQTFGSQNSIDHNDILASEGTTATYIKSCSRHVSIFDNYLEKPGCEKGVTKCVSTFIDVTKTGAPAYGQNVRSSPLSIVIRDNRIDGQKYANNSIILDPNASSIVCDNRETTAEMSPAVFENDVHQVYSVWLNRTIRIRGQHWGVWHGFDSVGPNTKTANGFAVDGTNIPSFVPNIDNIDELVIRGPIIVIPATFATSKVARIVPGIVPQNQLFCNGVTYSAKVIARTTSSSGDVLQIAMGSDGHGDSLNSFSLNTQFMLFSWAFSGKPLSGYDRMGAYMKRSTNNGDIEILSVSWE